MNSPQFVRSGSSFNLSCSAVSSPAATFNWFHDQQLMENFGPVLTLKVIEEHGFPKKAGNYTCGANNDKTKRAVSSPVVTFTVMGESLRAPPERSAHLSQSWFGQFVLNTWMVWTLQTVCDSQSQPPMFPW